MTYRVAVAISGAVSLGSYEAGTLHEIIKAFTEHNKNEQSPEKHIKIDVLTGASAGGMTAALVAHKLLHDPEMLQGDEENAGYLAWVEKVDIEGLLAENPGDFSRTSLLSSGCVANIAKNLIIDRHNNGQLDNTKPHIVAADSIQLGLAMANLNGIDYSVNTFSSSDAGLDQGQFVQTRFQDRFTRELDSNYDPAEWENIILASRGCGAFPFAFSPVELVRNWFNEPQDYAHQGASQFSHQDNANGRSFYYMDGGAFNNYPLGMARDLADKVDKTPKDYDNRYYIYISPNAKDSVQEIDFKVNAQTTMKETALRMASSIFWQGRFQEWMQIDSVNKQIRNLDDRALQLLTALKKMNDDNRQAALKTSDTFLNMLYASPAEISDAVNRLSDAYSDTEGFETLPDDLKEIWLKGIAVLEKSGDLNNREQMKVYTVTANDEYLASEPLAAFMGFLDIELRKHDYLLGRINGMTMVQHILNANNNAIQNVQGQHIPLNVESRKADIEGAKDVLSKMKKNGKPMREMTMALLNDNEKELLYQRVKVRMKQWLKNENVGGFGRRLIWFGAKKFLKDALHIKDKRLLGIKMPWWYR